MAAPLEIYLLTFNCARTLVDPALLGAGFFSAWPSRRPELPDVVAVSLQEVAPIAYSFLGESWIAPYLERVEESLHVATKKRGGSRAEYTKVATHSVGMTAALVYVKKSLADRVRRVEKAGVGVGVWEMGNKGGVGIRLDLDGTDLTFVAMHLAPMEELVQRRNQDWKDIVQGLVFGDAKNDARGAETEPLLKEQTTSGLYKPESHIFLFGDLNYRTSHLAPTVSAHKTFPQPALPADSMNNRIPLPELLARDQLTQERLAGRVLHGFEEAPITFPPTYKYSHTRSEVPGPQAGKDDSTATEEEEVEVEGVEVQELSIWTWAKHRWPSWCDRIVYYPPTGITAGRYTALPLLPSSDHRAVALHVTLQRASRDQTIQDDLREKPPFTIDEQWKARRAAARRYEVVVGMASWVVLTSEGQATIAGLLGGALAVYVLVQVFGRRA
jgi:hypothetical protein